jgi:hypothetical protein
MGFHSISANPYRYQLLTAVLPGNRLPKTRSLNVSKTQNPGHPVIQLGLSGIRNWEKKHNGENTRPEAKTPLHDTHEGYARYHHHR